MKGEDWYEIRTRYKSVWHLNRPRFMPCNLFKPGMIAPCGLILSSMSQFQPYWYKNNHTNRKNRWYESNIVFFNSYDSSKFIRLLRTHRFLSFCCITSDRWALKKLKQAQSVHFRVVTTRGVYLLRSDITRLSDVTKLEV